MAPLRLLAALLAAHLQLNSGQQIIEGNNLVAVASHKLAAIKQQSQKQNTTDTDQTIDSEDKLELTTDKYLEQGNIQGNINTSGINPGSGAMTSIKFVKNPLYDGPLPTFSIINNENASNPIFGTLSHDAALFNLSSASSNREPKNTVVGQVVSQQAEDNVGTISKSPVFIRFAPQGSGAVSSQSPYIINTSPPQPYSSNVVTLQPSPQLKQQSLQTSQAQIQGSSVQNPTNMRLRFVPTSAATVPFQGADPLKSTVPIQRQVPLQNTLPIHNTLPIQNTVPKQNTAPMPNSLSLQSTMPIQNTVPIHSTIQRAISNVPLQNPVANVLHNPNMALLLSHVLSQNSAKPECSLPINTMCTSPGPKPPKQTTVKTLLPLLLQLLTEKNNNCCEYKNKNERSYSHSRYKTRCKNAYEKFDDEFGRYEGNHRYSVNKNKRFKKPLDETLEDEDYSDEMSDYTAEEYDDED